MVLSQKPTYTFIYCIVFREKTKWSHGKYGKNEHTYSVDRKIEGELPTVLIVAVFVSDDDDDDD